MEEGKKGEVTALLASAVPYSYLIFSSSDLQILLFNNFTMVHIEAV